MPEDRQIPPAATEPPEATAPDETAAPTSWRQNFLTRFAVGVPALIVALLLITWAPVRLLAVVIAAAGVLGTYEYTRLMLADGRAVLPRRSMLVAAGAVGIGGITGSPVGLGAGLLVGVGLVVGTIWFVQGAAREDSLRDIGSALAGLLLVPWLLNHLGLLVSLPDGRPFFAFVIVAITLNDTLAYLVGTFLGSHPLMPTVSPKKTVEGALGGIVGGVLGGVIARMWLGDPPLDLSLPLLAGLGAVLAVAGQLGDLVESKLKRLTGAEDSGSFLPGHGGLLDRVDAYLLAAPVAYYLLAFVLP